MRLPRQAGAVLDCEHSGSGIRLALDHSIGLLEDGFGGWGLGGGVSVRMTRPAKDAFL